MVNKVLESFPVQNQPDPSGIQTSSQALGPDCQRVLPVAVRYYVIDSIVVAVSPLSTF